MHFQLAAIVQLLWQFHSLERFVGAHLSLDSITHTQFWGAKYAVAATLVVYLIKNFDATKVLSNKIPFEFLCRAKCQCKVVFYSL